MTPTLEEVKKVAEECDAEIVYLYDEEQVEATQFLDHELQAFAQHFKEEGRKKRLVSLLA